MLADHAEVAELADAPALGAGGRKAVGVRVPSSAPICLSIPPSENYHYPNLSGCGETILDHTEGRLTGGLKTEAIRYRLSRTVGAQIGKLRVITR